MRPLRLSSDGWSIEILDQTRLPHEVVVARITTLDQVVEAIATMQVRGAPLIGLTGAYGVCLALMTDESDAALDDAVSALLGARPTAVNLRHAVEAVREAARAADPGARAGAAYARAAELCDIEIAACRAIGDYGLGILQQLHTGAATKGGGPVRVLTHCNAGWLATLEYGTALAPVYRAHEVGLPVHVWVDETRPRSQGWLTAWELGASGVSHTVVSDTSAGYLLQRGEVDVVIVGTDRTLRTGDVCNKIGTYLVALAAGAARIPFYAAVPSSSIDWSLDDWGEIPIEERPADEVRWVRGRDPDGALTRVAPGPSDGVVRNVAFDVTPARLVTGLITERGVCTASRRGLLALFPERRRR
ncbi:MAG TPA: S-methyl-5-thioribose-1-phosphate isomerase [Gemmatimonadales bacterium]